MLVRANVCTTNDEHSVFVFPISKTIDDDGYEKDIEKEINKRVEKWSYAIINTGSLVEEYGASEPPVIGWVLQNSNIGTENIAAPMNARAINGFGTKTAPDPQF